LKRLLFGFGKQGVEFPIDAIHHFDQTVQRTIERGLVETLAIRGGRSISASIVFRLF